MESEELPINEELESSQLSNETRYITFDAGSPQEQTDCNINTDASTIPDDYPREERLNKKEATALTLAEALRQAFAYYNSPAYKQAVEAVRNGLLAAAKTAQAIAQNLAESAAPISETFALVAGNLRYTQILEKSMWPLHLVDDEGLIEQIRLIDAEEPEEVIAQKVSEAAIAHLNQEWLEETRARWNGYEPLQQDVREMLNEALNYHGQGAYTACVAVLMNMLTGFIEMFGAERLDPDSRSVEIFDWLAGKHGLKAYGAKRRLGSRDQAIIMLLKTDRGLYTWNSAVSYVVDVVFTNRFDEQIAEHNPLRNKICHGVQVNFGTLEHSLKSILVTDLILRLGMIATLDGLDERDDNADESMASEQ